MKKKIGYKVLVKSLSGHLYSLFAYGMADVQYHPSKVIRSKRFLDGSKIEDSYIRLPLLVFKTLRAAKDYMYSPRPNLEIWRVKYIQGKPFVPTDIDILSARGIYYDDTDAGHKPEFPPGTDFADCLKLIEPVDIKETK